MSYVANQYNYATPLSSVVGLTQESSAVAEKKYFTLFDNKLDGSYYPITGDVGLWGSVVSDTNGNLDSPFTVTVTENLTMHSFRLTGSEYAYPVAFTVKLYNGDALLYTIQETANSSKEYTHYFASTLSVTSYEVSITKISAPNAVARLYNVYYPTYLKRSDNMRIAYQEIGEVTFGAYFMSSDSLSVGFTELAKPTVEMLLSDTLKANSTGSSSVHLTAHVQDDLKVSSATATRAVNTINVAKDGLLIAHRQNSAITNTIDVTRDILKAGVEEDISHVTNIINVTRDRLGVKALDADTLTNVHSRMKDPSRKIYGKVYITYTDPMLESDTEFDYSSVSYNSHVEQLTDNIHKAEQLYFTLYDNNLTGDYKVMDENSQVGWSSAQLSNADGTFDDDVWVAISFEPRPVKGFIIAFDESHGNIVKDFVVILVTTDNAIYNYEYRDNNEPIIEVIADGYEIKTVTVMIARVERPYSPATILSLPLSSTILYRGYKDESELISIDLLEELTYEDEVEALGGVSANEVTVTLDNSNRDFFFNSFSLVSKQLKRNRKIVPWLGVEIVPGEIEWYTLGTFWSYKWDVPTNGLSAKVVGFDTIGLLDTTSFTKHHMLLNKSVAELITYVLEDAKTQLNFIEYIIDPALNDIVIPYAWFENDSHTNALRKISMCYPMHIYCDRQGRICAAPQKLKLDYYYDTWSNSTNVVDKNYSSLYTTLPNVINVSVINPVVVPNAELAKDDTVFNAPATVNVTFNKPCISDVSLVVDCDRYVVYHYEVYSWGAVINFSGTGQVRSITCVGDALDVSNTTIVTKTDKDSVRLNGSVKRDISSPFIQTTALANSIIGRIDSLSEHDKYDASVDYRGDISLSINDPILLKDGIAPSDKYNIKRHQLFWDGSLSGSAELNT